MAATYQDWIQALELHGSRTVGKNWQCPAHLDDNPSLSISEGTGGKVLAKCFAGCSFDDIRAALGLTDTPSSPRTPAPPREPDPPPEPEPFPQAPDGVWEYRHADGSLAFKVTRHNRRDGGKFFQPWQPTDDPKLWVNPNPPKDTDGRREDSGRGWVRELQGRWPGVLG